MKILLLAVVHLLITETSAQATNVISSHVLDISSGRPAVGVHTTAFFLNDHNQWILVGNSLTDSSGRIANVHQGHQLLEGQYQLHFDTGPYFANHGMSTFYPYIKVVFDVYNSSQHYHVPITLSNYGYSTYRGQ